MRAAVATAPPVGDSAAVAIAQLVERARAGDRAAWSELYARHRGAVHAAVLTRVAHADAADVAQDVFVVALARLAELTEPAAFPGWLLTIARRRAIDHARRARRQPIDTDADVDAAPPIDDGALPTHGPDTRRALAAIRQLPPAYQEPLLMRLVFGLTGPEIATQTGLTPASVRVNLCRGMALLRQALADATEEAAR